VPLVEQTALFVRGIGDATDIVEKEMYVFEDRNGESLALRPEATAGIVRSAIEHNFLYNGPMRVWTTGPMFRYERPQKVRQRQFHQFDVEALGFDGPDVDAEQIVLLARLWEGARHPDVELHFNSIGDAPTARPIARSSSPTSRSTRRPDEDAKRRLHTNPLRILDSKIPDAGDDRAARRALTSWARAPEQHFRALNSCSTDAGSLDTVNPRLVRGLDYYNRTVFEFVTPHRRAVAPSPAAGATTRSSSSLGGKPTPACGFGMASRAGAPRPEGAGGKAAFEPDAFVVHFGRDRRARGLENRREVARRGLKVVLGTAAASSRS
jgi:histidyl-tRNA synthetase